MHDSYTTRQHERAVEVLGEEIRIRTHQSNFFCRRGAVWLDELRAYHYKQLKRLAESYSTRSSTYYAAASNAKALATNAPLFLKPFWLAVGFLCKIRFQYLADRLMQQAGGFGFMDANQADLYVHTLFARGEKRYDEALRYIEMLIRRPDASKDNKALMFRIEAEIFGARGEYQKAFASLTLADRLLDQLPPLTVVRILRTHGVLRDRQHRVQVADRYFEEASALAKTHGFTGQLERIKARQ